MSRIKRGSPPKKKGNIPLVAEEDKRIRLTFSFRHLDLHLNAKFSLTRCQDGYIDTLLKRLRDLSHNTIGELVGNRSRALRSHPINWSETTEKAGFTCLNTQLRAKEAWQFELTRDKHGRVHGFLMDDTFYVVWIDPDHKLYS